MCTLAAACTAASQQREAKPSNGLTSSKTGSSSSTSTSTATGTEDASEQANEAAEVAGAFLTCDYSGEGDAAADEADVGCMVKSKDGTRMDMPAGAMSASLDMGTGAPAVDVPVVAVGDWHFSFPMPMAAMPQAVVSARVELALLGGVDLTFALSELVGTVQPSLTLAGVFDFTGVELTSALAADSYCTGAGRRDTVIKEQRNPVGNPVLITVGSFSTTPGALVFTSEETCFEPLAPYIGTEPGALFAPDDANSRLISKLESTGGGGPSCFLAVARLGDEDGPAKALVVIEPGTLAAGDVKRTAAAHACQN